MKYFLAILFSTLLASSVLANDPSGHWYNPSKPGYGVQINRDSGAGHAITWYLYRKDGSSAFLTAFETCEEFPCIVSLSEPTSRFLDGNADLGNAVGSLELTPQPDGTLKADYDLRAWLGEECNNLSGGGLLFRGCIGKFNLSRIAF